MGVLICVFIVAESRIIHKIYLISTLQKELWNWYFLMKLHFEQANFSEPLLFLRTPIFSEQLYFSAKAAFSEDAIYWSSYFFTANVVFTAALFIYHLVPLIWIGLSDFDNSYAWSCSESSFFYIYNCSRRYQNHRVFN